MVAEEPIQEGTRMTVVDLINAVHFLRRLSVGQMEAEVLIKTVESLEAEIEKRRRKK
jgi:hypothetical protein